MSDNRGDGAQYWLTSFGMEVYCVINRGSPYGRQVPSKSLSRLDNNMHKEMWVVYVDGLTYGFFDSLLAADKWVTTEFPVAYQQGRYTISEFCSV